MKTATYKIADIYFKINYDFSYEIPDGNAIDFKVDTNQSDFIFNFQKTNHIQDYLNNATILSRSVVYDLVRDQNNRIIHAFSFQQTGYYDAITIFEEHQANIYYIDENSLLEKYNQGYNYLNYCCLERVFPSFNALVLHSSHINLGSQAILFSAPSQTGKSTQARLWESQGLCTVINGDRTVIRKVDNQWMAYGCPMCGTSGIHINSAEPLKTIVMLEKGLDNSITVLKGRKAFMQVYPQITMPDQFADLVNHNIDILSELLEEIPIYYYSCTKEIDAVYTLKEYLGV